MPPGSIIVRSNSIPGAPLTFRQILPGNSRRVWATIFVESPVGQNYVTIANSSVLVLPPVNSLIQRVSVQFPTSADTGPVFFNARNQGAIVKAQIFAFGFPGTVIRATEGISECPIDWVDCYSTLREDCYFRAWAWSFNVLDQPTLILRSNPKRIGLSYTVGPTVGGQLCTASTVQGGTVIGSVPAAALSYFTYRTHGPIIQEDIWHIPDSGFASEGQIIETLIP